MGTNITALIRDLLMYYANMPASEAQRIVDQIERDQIDNVDWLMTGIGVMFTKSFDPRVLHQS